MSDAAIKEPEFWIASMPLNSDIVRLDRNKLSELEAKVAEDRQSSNLWQQLFHYEHGQARLSLERMKENGRFYHFNDKRGWIGFGTDRTSALKALCAAREEWPNKHLEH